MSEPASVQRFAGQRVQFESPLPFLEVVGNFRSLVGTASMAGSGEPKASLGEQYGDAMGRIGGAK